MFGISKVSNVFRKLLRAFVEHQNTYFSRKLQKKLEREKNQSFLSSESFEISTKITILIQHLELFVVDKR